MLQFSASWLDARERNGLPGRNRASGFSFRASAGLELLSAVYKSPSPRLSRQAERLAPNAACQSRKLKPEARSPKPGATQTLLHFCICRRDVACNVLPPEAGQQVA